jgi:TonB family protein
MPHGIDPYFEELLRSRRRFALASGVTAALAVLLMVSLRGHAVRDALEEAQRFGFEGPDQWVERIRLEELGREERLSATNYELVFDEGRKGGERATPTPTPTQRNGSEPRRRPLVPGPGDLDRDLLARARALRLEGPVVMSDQLISEVIVKPDYPEAAIDGDIEGVVELVALVDTTGAVVQVQILKSPHPLLEKAAVDAVLQCRYRPFRIQEHALRTWAAFRYSFSLYSR